MIENVTQEKLQEILNEIIIPNSNIGVHKMTGPYADNYEKSKIVYDKILQNGFIASGGEKGHHGITTHICMCGVNNKHEARNILDWDFGQFNKEGIKIIFAIPSIIDGNGKKYYIGEFPEKSEGKNIDAESIPYSDIDIVPPEFIVGCLKVTYGPGNDEKLWTTNNTFILNQNYIGLKSEIEQQSFFDKYSEHLEDYRIPTLDEAGFDENSDYYNEFNSQGDFSNYYYKMFLEKYKELVMSDNKKY